MIDEDVEILSDRLKFQHAKFVRDTIRAIEQAPDCIWTTELVLRLLVAIAVDIERGDAETVL